MDGVIADCAGDFARAFGLDPSDTPKIYGLEQSLGRTWPEINRVARRSGFWAGMTPLPWATRLVGTLSRLSDLFILSHPWENYPMCHAEKIKWCVDLGIPAKRVILTEFKHLLAGHGRILIDDLEANCQKWQLNGGSAIQFPAHHNDWNNSGYMPSEENIMVAVMEALERALLRNEANLTGQN